MTNDCKPMQGHRLESTGQTKPPLRKAVRKPDGLAPAFPREQHWIIYKMTCIACICTIGGRTSGQPGHKCFLVLHPCWKISATIYNDRTSIPSASFRFWHLCYSTIPTCGVALWDQSSLYLDTAAIRKCGWLSYVHIKHITRITLEGQDQGVAHFGQR